LATALCAAATQFQIANTLYTCRDCGGNSAKWLGQCPHCKAWNSLDETLAEVAAGKVAGRYQHAPGGAQARRDAVSTGLDVGYHERFDPLAPREGRATSVGDSFVIPKPFQPTRAP